MQPEMRSNNANLSALNAKFHELASGGDKLEYQYQVYLAEAAAPDTECWRDMRYGVRGAVSVDRTTFIGLGACVLLVSFRGRTQ